MSFIIEPIYGITPMNKSAKNLIIGMRLTAILLIVLITISIAFWLSCSVSSHSIILRSTSC
jgi:hypothetical protein